MKTSPGRPYSRGSRVRNSYWLLSSDQATTTVSRLFTLMGWLHAGLHPQRAESFCNLKLPHLAQSLHLGEVFLLERKSYESPSFPIVSNPMSTQFPAIRRLVLISRHRGSDLHECSRIH